MSLSTIHPSWLDVLSDSVRLDLLWSLVDLGEASAAELARRANCSDPTLRRHLEALAALGLVYEHRGESDGTTTGRPASRFRLDPKVRENATALFRVLERPLGPSP